MINVPLTMCSSLYAFFSNVIINFKLTVDAHHIQQI